MTGATLLLSVAGLGAALPSRGGPAPSDTSRARAAHLEAGYGVEAFARDRSAWQTASLRAGYRWTGVTAIGEVSLSSRFDRWDRGAAGEAYLAVSRGLSGFARIQIVPEAAVLPRTDIQAGLDRALGGGWEGGVTYRRMGFRGAAIDIVGLAATRYLGRWYLQARGTLVPERGRTGGGIALRARRYRDPDRPDELVEVSAVLGQEVVLLGAGVRPAVRSTASLEARVVRRLSSEWGVSAGLSWAREERVPSRFGARLALRRDW
jgi:YaiO family outer membrane protein